MKIIIVALFLLLPLPLAAQSFDERKSELLKELETKAPDEKHRKKVREGLIRYFDNHRNRALAEGLKMIDKDDHPRNAGENWKNHFGKAGNDAGKMLEDLVQDDASDALNGWIIHQATLEIVFFNKIRSMPLARIRDRLAKERNKFKVETESCRKKWQRMKSDDASIDSRAARARRELDDIYKEVLRDVAESSRKWLTGARKVLKAATFAGPGAVLGDAPNWLYDKISRYEDRIKARMEQLDSLFRRENTVIHLFKDTRQAVKRFLEVVNLKKAEEYFKEGISQTGSAAGSMPSDGLKKDAESFKGAAEKRLSNHLGNFELAYKEFIGAYNYIFIGAVNSRTVQELLETEAWSRWFESGGKEVSGIESALKKLHEDVEDCWDLSLDELTDEQKESVKKEIKEALKKIDSSRKIKEKTMRRLKGNKETRVKMLESAKRD